jgi:hypothetical protein
VRAQNQEEEKSEAVQTTDPAGNVFKETLTQLFKADAEGKAVPTQSSLAYVAAMFRRLNGMNDDFEVDEETTRAFAAYLLSKFLQNDN